jgi:hypothetical protein
MSTTRETGPNTSTSTSTSSDPGPGPGPVGVEPPNKLLPPAVFKRWVHVQEEDEDGVEVYKPFGTALPVAFARDGFEMRKDGRFVQDVIGPADGVVRVPGHWRPIGPRQVAASFASERVEDYAFAIVSVEATRLRRRLIRMPDGDAGGAAGGRP